MNSASDGAYQKLECQPAAMRRHARGEVPAATIRTPDAALFDCAPDDARPLPASHVKVIVEVVSPSSRKADKLDKMAEYADAGILFYWLAWLSGNHVLSRP